MNLCFFRQFLSTHNRNFFKVLVQISRIGCVLHSVCEHFLSDWSKKIKSESTQCSSSAFCLEKKRKLSKFLWTVTSSWFQLVHVQVQAGFRTVLACDIQKPRLRGSKYSQIFQNFYFNSDENAQVRQSGEFDIFCTDKFNKWRAKIV